MSIVVAYRDSSAGRDALRLGVRLALTRHTVLQIITVIQPGAGGSASAETRAAAERALFDANSLVQAPLEVHTHVEESDSEVQGIQAAVHRLGGNILVIGTASGGLLGRFTLGSVSNALLHSSDFAIALAPDNSRERDREEVLSRVSVAVGDLGGNRTLFDTAAYLADSTVPVRLLTLATVAEHEGDDERAKVQTAAIGALNTAALGRFPTGLDLSTRVEVASRIDQAIDQVDWEPAEVVLIGSSRIAQSKVTFLGPTAAKLVRQLTVPMIVVPRDERVYAEH